MQRYRSKFTEQLRQIWHRRHNTGAELIPIDRAGWALERKHVLIIQPSGIKNRARVLKVARSIRDSGRSVVIFSKFPAGSGFKDVAVERVLDCPVLYFPDAHDFLVAARTKIPALNWSFMVQYLGVAMWHYALAIKPRVIHTFNSAAIGIGHDLRDRLRATGHEAAWIHDFQEYTAGHRFGDDRASAGPDDEEWRQVVMNHEATHAGFPDHAFTVSPQLSKSLADDYKLPVAPTVLLNVPRRGDFKPGYHSTIRKTLRLPDAVPLFVYSGGVTRLRGVHTLVAALEALPEAHVALVANDGTPYFASLLDRARALGAANRLHVLPYVDSELVPSFLQDATAGVHPLTRYGNAEIALPNKLFDYLHARLPLVVSNAGAMSEFVETHGVGVVFDAENVTSLVAALRRVLELREPIQRRIEGDAALLDRYAWDTQEPLLLAAYERLEAQLARFPSAVV